MPSPDRGARTSLRARVAAAAALVAALVGLVSAGVAALLVEELQVAAQDERLTNAASLMQREIDTEGGDPRAHVDSEAVEIAPVGLRITLFENGKRTAGAADIGYADREGCESREGRGGLWRTCAIGAPARRVVVSTHREGERSRGPLLVAVGAAALVAALIAALVSRALAGWALAPLSALGKRLEKITDVAPGDADLGPASGTAEVDALRDTLGDLLRRLGEAIERSRGFASSAAHELRTPLATMMAELDLASEQSPVVLGSLARVRRTVGRLSVLVERLLLIANGEANALAMDAVAVEDVVRDCLAALAEPERARVTPRFDGSGMVRGDEAVLRIVVDNLVDNALKFSGAGNVEVVVSEEAGEVRLVVRDEGPGIDPADAERLFLPFARGEQAAVPGHGLGLSIVAHAVRLHGGDVRFMDRDAGSELRVTLPVWTARL